MRRVPAWVLHAALALVLSGLALAIAMARTDLPGGTLKRLGLLPLLAPGLAWMLLRDAAVVTCLTLTTRVRQPLATGTFYIAVADFLVPGLLAVVGAPMAAQFVFPLWALMESPLLAIAGIAAQAVIAVGFLAWRMRKAIE